jgi:hypothetical protein
MDTPPLTDASVTRDACLLCRSSRLDSEGVETCPEERVGVHGRLEVVVALETMLPGLRHCFIRDSWTFTPGKKSIALLGGL